MTQAAPATIRVLYKRISDPTVKKLLAESNSTPSGGGARDIRFSDFDFLLPLIKKFFPNTEYKKTKKFYTGNLHWVDADTGITKIEKAEFWEPTPSRDNEGRISKVHKLQCFALSRMMSAKAEGGQILMLLVQQSDSTVWPHYVSENSLRNDPTWDQKVARAILNCLDREGEGKAKTTQGYIDFTKNTRYCNHD